MSKNKQKFSFVVGNETQSRSNVWHVIPKDNNIYLMSKSFASSYKISLHESGACHAALTSEYMASTNLSNSERFLDKWEIKYEQGKATIAFSIVFPYSQLVLTDKIQSKQDLLLIEPPKIGSAVEVIIYKTGVSNINVDDCVPAEYQILKSFVLKNGEWVILMYCEYLLDEAQKSMIEEMRKIAVEKKTECGIQDRVIASAFGFAAPNGQRRLCEIYV